MCTQKMRALSYIGAEKITFPPKMTERQTYIQTASLLKKTMIFHNNKKDRPCNVNESYTWYDYLPYDNVHGLIEFWPLVWSSQCIL